MLSNTQSATMQSDQNDYIEVSSFGQFYGAAENGDLKYIQEVNILDLISYANQDNIKTGLTPLMAASMNGRAKVVDYLLEKGANHEIKDKNGYDALFMSAEEGQTGVLKVYKARNILQININNQYGEYKRTMLIAASIKGHENTVEFLLEEGANPTIKDTYQNTAFFRAAYKGFVSVMEKFIAIDNINALINDEGIFEFMLNEDTPFYMKQTPLIAASHKGHTLAVKFLLGKGADHKNVVSCYSKSSEPISTFVSDFDAVAMASFANQTGVLKEFKAAKKLAYSLNRRNGQTGLTPLMLACSTVLQSPDTAIFLLEEGADPGVKTLNKHMFINYSKTVSHFLNTNGSPTLEDYQARHIIDTELRRLKDLYWDFEEKLGKKIEASRFTSTLNMSVARIFIKMGGVLNNPGSVLHVTDQKLYLYTAYLANQDSLKMVVDNWTKSLLNSGAKGPLVTGFEIASQGIAVITMNKDIFENFAVPQIAKYIKQGNAALDNHYCTIM